MCIWCFFFFSSRRRHTRYWRDWSSDVCSSDLRDQVGQGRRPHVGGLWHRLQVRSERQIERHTGMTAEAWDDPAPQVRVDQGAVDEDDRRAVARNVHADFAAIAEVE